MQTAVNRRAGANPDLVARDRGVALATLLFFAPLFALLPKAALAALVIAYSINLFSPLDFAISAGCAPPNFGGRWWHSQGSCCWGR